MKVVIIIALTVVFLLLLWFLLSSSSAVKLPDPTYPRTVSTKPLAEMRALVALKPDYIRANSFLQPYNTKALELVEQTLQKSDITEAQLALQSIFLLPNSSVGMAPIEPVSRDDTLLNFQFGQGLVGWYFHYGTAQNASYFLYIARLEVVPADIVVQKKLPLGSTVYYSIGAGIGVSGQWHYLPFTIIGGTYTEQSAREFIFTAQNNQVHCTFSGSDAGDLHTTLLFTDATGVACSLQAVATAERPAAFNGPSGCVPCVGGAGTLYWSFPYMTTTFSATIGSLRASVSGLAWLDRQWISTAVSSNAVNIFANIAGTFHNAGRGLGRYLWLNLIVSKDLQYAVTAFPTDIVKVGSTYEAKCVRYGDKTTFDVPAQIRIEQTMIVASIAYPIIIHISVEGKEFILDGTSYGECVTIDATNNYHWTGSALLRDATQKLIGYGFIEANRLQDGAVYLANLLGAANVPLANGDLFATQNFSFGQTWTSFLFPVAMLAVVVAIICLLI